MRKIMLIMSLCFVLLFGSGVACFAGTAEPAQNENLQLKASQPFVAIEDYTWNSSTGNYASVEIFSEKKGTYYFHAWGNDGGSTEWSGTFKAGKSKTFSVWVGNATSVSMTYDDGKGYGPWDLGTITKE